MDTNRTRFRPTDLVRHNGRPAVVAAVYTEDGSTRYHVYYTDAIGGAAFALLGRVLEAR